MGGWGQTGAGALRALREATPPHSEARASAVRPSLPRRSPPSGVLTAGITVTLKYRQKNVLVSVYPRRGIPRGTRGHMADKGGAASGRGRVPPPLPPRAARPHRGPPARPGRVRGVPVAVHRHRHAQRRGGPDRRRVPGPAVLSRPRGG